MLNFLVSLQRIEINYAETIVICNNFQEILSLEIRDSFMYIFEFSTSRKRSLQITLERSSYVWLIIKKKEDIYI